MAARSNTGPLTFFERMKAANVTAQNMPSPKNVNNENSPLRPDAKDYSPFQQPVEGGSGAWDIIDTKTAVNSSHSITTGSMSDSMNTKTNGNVSSSALHGRPALKHPGISANERNVAPTTAWQTSTTVNGPSPVGITLNGTWPTPATEGSKPAQTPASVDTIKITQTQVRSEVLYLSCA